MIESQNNSDFFPISVTSESTIPRPGPSLLPCYRQVLVLNITYTTKSWDTTGDTVHGGHGDLDEEARGLAWDPGRLKLC